MSYYDEVEIEDMEFHEEDECFYFPCPCGDLFQISVEQLRAGEEEATCPSCSLVIRVIYDPEDYEDKGAGGAAAEEAAAHSVEVC